MDQAPSMPIRGFHARETEGAGQSISDNAAARTLPVNAGILVEK
jgi:hypothetical protein